MNDCSWTAFFSHLCMLAVMMFICEFVLQLAVLFFSVMDLSEEQETLGGIGSEAFSASSEILTEETDSLMACPSDDCADVDVTSGKQGPYNDNYYFFYGWCPFQCSMWVS